MSSTMPQTAAAAATVTAFPSAASAAQGGLPATASSHPMAAVKPEAVIDFFFSLQGFELVQRVAKMFASSSLVPEVYRGNTANCAIALNLAQRLKADPLMVMQNLYIVHGNPGWSSKFLIASINQSGRFHALRYEWRGTEGSPDRGCRAVAIERATGELLTGVWVDWKMVSAEKWDKKNGSKWLTMAEQMFVYRAAAFWQRAYAPEIALGLPTAEDLHDYIDGEIRDVSSVSDRLAALNKRMADAEPAPETALISDDASPKASDFTNHQQLLAGIAAAQTAADLAELQGLLSTVHPDHQAEVLARFNARLVELEG